MTALAIFVKTPGLSPLKTRLAAGIGAERAAHFYLLAVASVAEVAAATMPILTPYWAVAEAEALAHEMWSGFPVVSQGEGGLGDRLDHVYRTLQERHGSVLLIGADAPQITPDLLVQAATHARPFVLGPALDGGFWLFGGARPIDASVWRSVTYSVAQTAEQLLQALTGAGDVQFVEALRDVDREDDLEPLRAALDRLPAALDAQMALSRWVRDVTRSN
jgi:rSAM/selenodomain-associated transferase 1